jgi:acetylcholinesterase
MRDYLINFAANLDPNYSSGFNWPKWTSGSPTLLTFLDGLFPLALGQDMYREVRFASSPVMLNPHNLITTRTPSIT